MRNQGLIKVVLAAVLVAGVTAGCEKKGPLEQAAEEVDEAVETVKDGKESTANKMDDAVDKMRK